MVSVRAGRGAGPGPGVRVERTGLGGEASWQGQRCVVKWFLIGTG